MFRWVENGRGAWSLVVELEAWKVLCFAALEIWISSGLLWFFTTATVSTSIMLGTLIALTYFLRWNMGSNSREYLFTFSAIWFPALIFCLVAWPFIPPANRLLGIVGLVIYVIMAVQCAFFFIRIPELVSELPDGWDCKIAFRF